ncbi:hypothetical protein HK100_006689 [Physocladia obscura]|uniref:DNA 3'-5' helicase n=1 Tax=Physocladia obscura TaxID=109957 RepID=A0AAD5XII2_9FUNG|nr:hypothetical protein HK100_006689 [Physocladia obscura]
MSLKRKCAAKADQDSYFVDDDDIFVYDNFLIESASASVPTSVPPQSITATAVPMPKSKPKPKQSSIIFIDDSSDHDIIFVGEKQKQTVAKTPCKAKNLSLQKKTAKKKTKIRMASDKKIIDVDSPTIAPKTNTSSAPGPLYITSIVEENNFAPIVHIDSGISLPLTVPPTPEQDQIVAFGRSLPSYGTGKVCRIVAGAGTGKTTTLCLLAQALADRGHQILYIVFNKAAQSDAESRFRNLGSRVVCRTMHAAALRYLALPHPDFKIVPVDDAVVKTAIETQYKSHVFAWIDTNWQPPAGDPKTRAKARENLAKLVLFYIFKTLESWYRGVEKPEKLRDKWLTYYPAKLKHQRLGFSPGTFYVDTALEIWAKMWGGNFPINHDSYLKYAQLGFMRFPVNITTILMDESQDATACQLDLFVTQPVKMSNSETLKNVFMVGDPAQSIYYFRGARPKELAQIHTKLDTPVIDFNLTRSFRFGVNVAHTANILLWIKSKSPQSKDFNPYVLVGGNTIPGTIVDSLQELPYPHTIIARSGVQLISKGIEAMVKFAQRKTRKETMEAEGGVNVDPTLPQAATIKIAINGNPIDYKTKLNDARDVFRLYKGERPKNAKFLQYENFQEFEQDVQDREMTEMVMILSLIDHYEDDLLAVITQFEEDILKKGHSVENANVILSTAHQAKGLEFDNVEVCDDFIELKTMEIPPDTKRPTFGETTQLTHLKKLRMQFSLNGWGDDLNLWYVAVTRTKKLLKLPDKWWKLVSLMENVQKGIVENNQDATVLEAFKNLFDTFALYLSGIF